MPPFRALPIMTDALHATIERVAADGMAFYRIPGLSIVVVREGEVVLRRGFGVRDAATGQPVTPRTRFAACSLTKSITSAALGLLVDAGSVGWDTRVRDVLPEFRLADPVATERTTLRDLLLHRSGIGRHDLVWQAADRDRAAMLAALAHLAPVHEFRARCAYSNLGYLVVGAAIERLAKQRWEDFVAERLLGPAGMLDAGFDLEASVGPDGTAWPHTVEEDAVLRVAPHPMANAPAGGLVASAEDLGRWTSVLLDEGRIDGRPVVPAAVVREMAMPFMLAERLEHPELGDALHYGLGLWCLGYRGERQLRHTGSLVGWSGLVAMLPARRIGVVVLTNRQPTPVPSALAYAAFDALAGHAPIDWLGRVKPLRAPWLAAQRAERDTRDAADAAASSSGRALGNYAGVYLHPGYGRMEIAEADGALTWSCARWRERLRPCGPDAFRLPGYPDRMFPDHRVLRFGADTADRIERLSVGFEPEVPDAVFVRAGAAVTPA